MGSMLTYIIVNLHFKKGLDRVNVYDCAIYRFEFSDVDLYENNADLRFIEVDDYNDYTIIKEPILY